LQSVKTVPQRVKEAVERTETSLRDQFTMKEEKCRRAEAEMEKNWAGKEFLSGRIGKDIETIASLIGANVGTINQIANRDLKEVPLINDVLRDLCIHLQGIASRQTGTLFSDAWFHSTYMEVRPVLVDGTDEQGNPIYKQVRESSSGARGTERRLVYVGWHTQDGLQPNSMVLNKTLAEGQGIAGIAWERKRAQIVDDPEADPNWVPHYEGQQKNYKSMVCVPVVRGDPIGRVRVIGVITVDTRIRGYFGTRGSREDEDRAANLIKPYANYIALLSAVIKRVSDTLARDPSNT
jgi:GAF domain-containing protein